MLAIYGRLLGRIDNHYRPPADAGQLSRVGFRRHKQHGGVLWYLLERNVANVPPFAFDAPVCDVPRRGLRFLLLKERAILGSQGFPSYVKLLIKWS